MSRDVFHTHGLAFTMWLAFAAITVGIPSEDVYRTVSPSVVLVRDGESHGSGIVLASSGLILTCYHVANSPLPLEIRAEVDENGRRVQKTFKKIEIMGVHSNYDLALLKIQNAQSVSFIPPSEAESPNINPGEECFVIANPDDISGTISRNTITKGLISTGAREIEGKKYIQASAPIDPDSAGGALCNKNGQIIGVVTFKIDQTEGLGFAIPFADLTTSQFKPIEMHKTDSHKMLLYWRAADRWLLLAQQTTDEEQVFASAMRFMCYRLALNESSDNVDLLNNVGMMYCDFKKYATAKAFLLKAVGLNPQYTSAYGMLGGIAYVEKEYNKALEYYEKVLTSTGGSMQATAHCAGGYGSILFDRHDYATAAYCLKWALMEAHGPRALMNKRQECYNASVETLPDKQADLLTDKLNSFSWEDMRAFVQLAPITVVPLCTNAFISKSETVTRGQLWSRKLIKPENGQINIVRAPFGVDIIIATQTLRWAVPDDQPFGRTAIILRIQEQGKSENYQRINFTVK